MRLLGLAPDYLPSPHLIRIPRQPVCFLIERTHKSHQGYGVGVAESAGQPAQVDTGLLKVECDRLEIAAQLLVGFGEGDGAF